MATALNIVKVKTKRKRTNTKKNDKPQVCVGGGGEGWEGWGGGASIDFYVVTIPAMDSVFIDIQLIIHNSYTVSCFTVKL